MKKIYILLIFASVLIISFYFFYWNTFITFQPVLFTGDKYEYYEPKNKIEFNKKLKDVLKNYEVDFKMSTDGNILIKRKLQSDTETIHNYTIKAIDSKWQPYNIKNN